MLESTVDLPNGLFLIAMILLTALCIVCSIVAALRAVSRGNARFLDTKAIVNKAAKSQLEIRAPENFKSCASPQTPTVARSAR